MSKEDIGYVFGSLLLIAMYVMVHEHNVDNEANVTRITELRQQLKESKDHADYRFKLCMENRK